MLRHRFKSAVIGSMLIISSGAVSSLFSQTYDYSHRKSKCALTVPANATIKVTQLKNHFVFGGAIARWAFDSLKAGSNGVTQNYGDAFLQYFDFGTPENEMKWGWANGGTTKGEPNFTQGDYLVDFLLKNDIKVRGHNLFWNEKPDWLPEWTRTLSKPDFKTAMQERITSAMTHYNGKCAQWDIINEIIHGENGSTPSVVMLEDKSGDANVFSWILDEARKIDKKSLFIINDYSLESNDGTIDKFVAKCKPIASKFDLVGIEGHYGGTAPTKNLIDSKVAKLVSGLGKKCIITELDWEISVAQTPAKIEEVMRSCFANKDVEGVVLWSWMKRKMWRDKLTCYFVDSLLTENDAGKKWKSVRKEFKTDTAGTADASGKFTFTGFQGKYKVIVNNDTQYVYLWPKDSVEILEVKTSVNPSSIKSAANAFSVKVNGTTIHLPVGLTSDKPLFISTYAINGKLIAKLPLNFNNGVATVNKLPSGCQVYRIGTTDKTYHSGMGMQVR